MTDPDLFLFVSHVSEDRPAALEVVEELERRGVPCWIAPRDVRPGKPFDDEIAEAIEACRAMLLIFSEHCNEHEYIRREITVAGESQKIIIPFRIENAQPRRGLRVRLSDLHWIDGFASRERAIDQVVRTIDPNRARQLEEDRRQQETEEQRLHQLEEEQRRQREEEQRRHRQRNSVVSSNRRPSAASRKPRSSGFTSKKRNNAARRPRRNAGSARKNSTNIRRENAAGRHYRSRKKKPTKSGRKSSRSGVVCSSVIQPTRHS